MMIAVQLICGESFLTKDATERCSGLAMLRGHVVSNSLLVRKQILSTVWAEVSVM
jgi:hypothetical protein